MSLIRGHVSNAGKKEENVLARHSNFSGWKSVCGLKLLSPSHPQVSKRALLNKKEAEEWKLNRKQRLF
jgi:hypothetical protein